MFSRFSDIRIFQSFIFRSERFSMPWTLVGCLGQVLLPPAVTRCLNRSWGVLAWWGVVGNEAKALAARKRFSETETKRTLFSAIATWVVCRRRVALWEGRLSTDVATSVNAEALCLSEYRDLLLTQKVHWELNFVVIFLNYWKQNSYKLIFLKLVF